jgi:hypothetical protein
MANGLQISKARNKGEDEDAPKQLGPPFPWRMIPFPFLVAQVTGPPPLKISLRKQHLDTTPSGD